MSAKSFPWNKLFLFCLGLFIASAFCMKWMEGDLLHNGSLFTIIGLEVSYPQEKVYLLLSGIDQPVRTILKYHLSFDFVFMAGVYTGIACLCMMVRKRWVGKKAASLLTLMALLQLVAWGCDIAENMYLLKWLKDPSTISSFQTYHLVVYAKWLIALSGVLLALTMRILRPSRSRKEGHL